MNGLMSQTAAWWDGRTLRERRMLALMGLAVAAVLVWLLIVRPVRTWREESADARLVAEANLDLVRRVAGRELSAGRSQGNMNLQATVEQANAATGAAPVLGMSADGELGFSLTNVSTNTAFGWLAALRDLKVRVTSLNVVENVDATLSMEGGLAPET